MDVASNLKMINSNIEKACQKSNRKREDITVIGVTKYVTIERVEELIQEGITNIGENRTEEMLKKYDTIGSNAKWHFIGTLQSRKVKDIIAHVTMIHSLDRLSVAKQINSRASKPVSCFIQVNISKEKTKYGLDKDDVITFIKDLSEFENINVVGLMTMAPHTEDEHEVRRVFRSLASLRNKVAKIKLNFAPCQFLSMGMSNDYQIAIEEGATHIRIGSKLVGTK